MSKQIQERSCVVEAVAGALLLLALAPTASATILTFDQSRVSGDVVPAFSGGTVYADYGDRVTGSPMNVSGGQFTYGDGGEGFTPNLMVDIFAGSATPINSGVSLWRDLYGDLTNVVIGNNNSLGLNVLIEADAGFEAQLHGFDLAGWPSADYTIAAVRVLDGGTTLYSQSNVLVEGNAAGPGHTSFAFATPLTGSNLRIQVDYSNLSGGQQDNIGIDNIRFGQTPPAPVPEPSTWLIVGVGLLAIGIRRGLSQRAGLRKSP